MFFIYITAGRQTIPPPTHFTGVDLIATAAIESITELIRQIQEDDYVDYGKAVKAGWRGFKRPFELTVGRSSEWFYDDAVPWLNENFGLSLNVLTILTFFAPNPIALTFAGMAFLIIILGELQKWK